MKIHDWNQHQSYRQDRGAPPWIKIHRGLMSNPKWAQLTDSEKGQLVSLWILAADKNGEIPDDAIILRKLCQLDESPNINKFIRLGFIDAPCGQPDVNLASTWRQDDAPETEAEADTETETEKKKNYAKKEETNHDANLAMPNPAFEKQPIPNDQPIDIGAAVMFEELWNIYPAKKEKPRARYAYMQVIRTGIDHETLVNSLKKQVALMASEKTATKYLKPLHDWLESDGWTQAEVVKRQSTREVL